MSKISQRQFVRDTVLEVLKEDGVCLEKGEKASDYLFGWGNCTAYKKTYEFELRLSNVLNGNDPNPDDGGPEIRNWWNNLSEKKRSHLINEVFPEARSIVAKQHRHQRIINRLKKGFQSGGFYKSARQSVSWDQGDYTSKILSERLKYDEELNGGLLVKKKKRLPPFMKDDEKLKNHRSWGRKSDVELRKLQLLVEHAQRKEWLDLNALPDEILKAIFKEELPLVIGS